MNSFRKILVMTFILTVTTSAFAVTLTQAELNTLLKQAKVEGYREGYRAGLQRAASNTTTPANTVTSSTQPQYAAGFNDCMRVCNRAWGLVKLKVTDKWTRAKEIALEEFRNGTLPPPSPAAPVYTTGYSNYPYQNNSNNSNDSYDKEAIIKDIFKRLTD